MGDGRVEANWKYIRCVLSESCLEYEDVGGVDRLAWNIILR